MIIYNLDIDYVASQSISYTPQARFLQLPLYLNGWGYFKANSNYFTKRDGQENFLLVHTLSGLGFLEYRGQKITLSKSDTFVIDCREFQYYGTVSNEHWEFLWLHFAGSALKSTINL